MQCGHWYSVLWALLAVCLVPLLTFPEWQQLLLLLLFILLFFATTLCWSVRQGGQITCFLVYRDREPDAFKTDGEIGTALHDTGL